MGSGAGRRSRQHKSSGSRDSAEEEKEERKTKGSGTVKGGNQEDQECAVLTGGNQTQTACDMNLEDERANGAAGGEQHPTKDFSTHTHTGFKSISQGDASV